ncbi:non-ribosomal peptide synthetase [Pseudonocardia sp. KRD291]|uniref:non-ribosomal peptide synthetase n=1 Tax=Pseudonocardia sp. KRD291 TaxID=2792007 RepID=UPI001C4A5DC4|nr:non-ribosomal peptide synthetase [Pseudonocardia sp. KRD291]MBW0101277.1 amino acid adenylation domain-containing protein [Pseudonocardia sp. KRD291]
MTRTLPTSSDPGTDVATWPRLFAEQVAATPDAIAVCVGTPAPADQPRADQPAADQPPAELPYAELTYAELDDRTARLASVLAARGAGPEQMVALAVPRGIDLVVALVAVLRTGAAYLPVDPDQPAARTGLVLDDARPAVLVGTTRTVDALGGLVAGTATLRLDDPDDAAGIAAADPHPSPEIDVRNAAYVIHTSGSTGRPKGVVLTHTGVAKLVATQTERLGVGPDARVLAFAATGFDLAFWELCMALLSGGRLVMVPAELRAPGPELADYISAHAITVMALPPALLAAMPDDVTLPPATLLAGTERVSPELVARWGHGRRMLNAYGPTEATVNSTLGVCDPNRRGPTVPIGVADPQTEAHVLDERLRPVPAGEEGELYLGGTGLARGYLGRPDLTAERFVADPFGPPGGRLYRTGDVVRCDEGGSLEYLGRTDDQVKIRGFRIEPGEIESVLAGHTDVDQVTVQVREPRPGERRLVAYVVPRPGAGAGAGAGADDLTGALREHLRERLPEHMVPAAVVALHALPVLANGKIDRAALPEPDLSSLVRGRRPGSPREELLCTLFSEVLDVPGIGVDDDFFALGGDSISSIQLARRAREAGLRITPRQLFEHPTVQELAGVATARKAGRAGAARPDGAPAAGEATAEETTAAESGDGPVDTDGTPDPVDPVGPVELDDTARAALSGLGEIAAVGPVSPLQEGFFFHAALGASGQGTSGPDVYTVQKVFDVGTGDGRPVDASAVRAAVQAVLDRHPQLRAGFAQRADGRIVQAIAARAELPWTERDLAGLPPERAGKERAAVLDAERVRRFDLAQPPLLRAALIHTGAGRAELALTFQHAVLDGWSVALVVREILQRYAGAAPTGDAPAQRLRDWFTQLGVVDAERPAALRAWADELAGIDEPTRLLPALPPPSDAGDAGDAQEPRRGEGLHEQRELELDERRTAALAEQARAHGLTLSTLLHGAWGMVVGALTGSADVLLGSTVSGRDAPVAGIDEAVGLFINTLPVRVRWRVGEPLSATLRRLQAARSALLDHQQVGLGELARLTGGDEPFDTLVVVENYPRAADTAFEGGLALHGEDVRDAVHYPVALLAATGPRLGLTLKYDADRVSAGAAELLLGLLDRHLDTFARTPGATVGSVPLRDTAGPDRGAELDVPEATLPGLITAQAARTPDATAVVADDATLTYAELESRTAELAARLRARGAGPGRVVGVAVPRSAELMVALVGVLRSGAAYLPLDLDYPPERLAFMVADARVDTVLVDLAAPGPALPQADGIELVPTAAQGPAPASEVGTDEPDPDDAAYLIYTSGSTGRPKGVLVGHRAIVNRLAWMQDTYRLGADDRVLQKTPASFDVSVWEFFWPLIHGARVVLARPDGHRDPEYLAGLIGRERITTMHFVPSMLQGFLAADAVTSDVSWARDLTRVFCSGEALPATAAARWRELTGVVLHNLYGPTEAAVDVTHHPVPEIPREPVPIGRPVANTRVQVLDPCLRPVPDGVPGELYLAGVQLARGYHGRAGLTADRFVADPLGGPGERMYRTGDVVRRTADGVLEYLGRSDDQIKIRGNRVEPGEIDAVLAGLPGVAGSAVVARREGAGHVLVAYVVPDGTGAGTDPEGLRAALAERLPAPMVPSAVVLLDALPLGPSGKLDRSALPAPDQARTGPAREPANDAERALCAAFAEVLGRDDCGPDDDFFALGGDSISSISVSTRARRAGLRVGPQDVLTGRTPAGIAAVAGDLSGADAVTVPAPVVDLPDEQIERLRRESPVPVAEVWPLSPLQDGLYFHASMDAGEDVYTIQETIELSEAVDIDRLRAACAQVIEANPAVRAGFPSEGLDRPVQIVAGRLDPPVTEVDLGDVPADEVHGRIEEVLAADRATPFDIARPPLFRIMVVRVPGGDRLVINRHQLLWDGWSGWLVIEQLLAAYAGRGIGPVGTYRDYLGWLACQDRESAANAWRDALSGLDGATLVGDTTSDAPAVAATSERHVELSAADAARLREFTRAHGVTANGVLSAVWGMTLGVLTGRTDVVFGTVVAGRTSEVPEVESAVGLFMNTVPVRMQFRAGERVRDALARLQDERLRTVAYEFVGLGEIQRVSGHRRLFDTLFVYRLEGGDERTDALRAEHGVASLNVVDRTHYPLNMIVTPGERIELMLSHALDDAAAAAVMDRYLALLGQVLDDADRPTAGLDPMPETERAALAAVRGGDEIEIGTETVADMLADRAGMVPDELALVCGDDRLTYAELDAAVNRTARLLIGHGAAPETVVALAVPRSVETVVALFAVLRTGAAYLPLELDHPAERLLGTLADAAPVCLVTVADMAPSLAPSGVGALVLDDPATARERAALDPAPLGDDELGAFARDAPDRLDRPAYLIYTSGSTGKPKGVVTPYRGLTNMQLNHRREIFDPVIAAAGNRRLRIAHTVSFAFDMSWEELLWLVEGHEVHVCDEELRRDADALVAYCAEHAVDVVNVTPTYATVLFETGLLDGPHPPPLVLLGGEAVSDAVWAALRETPGVLGYNLYGPTEYTINTLGAGTDDSATPTVGRPITNTVAHVLDAWLRPVPDGVPGELYIAGAGLARGYAGRFGQTAERFVADPWTGAGRMYRTGDLVCRRTDGSGVLDFLGRTDDQVKIRGHRVEPGEVTAKLNEHPRVAHSAVIPAKGPDGGATRLVAYLVPASPQDPDVVDTDVVAAVRDDLRVALPDYLVPSAFVVVDALPLTANGKLDVRALPEPDAQAGAAPSRAPEGDVERALCEIFAQVLGLDEVGVDDDFFDLGGDSISSIQVARRSRKKGVRLTPRQLFDHPSVASLARVLAGPDEEDQGPARPVLEPMPRPDPLPVSPAQQRLWIVERLEGEAGRSGSYNFPLTLRLRGDLDTDALQAALGDVVTRHEALRTVFPDVDGAPVQVVAPADEVVVPFVRRAVAEGDVAGAVTDAVRRPFDLGTEIPLRATVLDVTGTPDHVLVLLLHHITTDERSDRPFLRDLSTAYAARVAGRAPELPALPVQYADYSVWQQRLLGDPADPASLAARQLAYWTGALAGVPERIDLPTDRVEQASPTMAAAEVEMDIDPELTEDLRRLARANGATMFMLTRAAVAVLLHRLGAGTDIPLGAPISGRTDEALDDVVGFFVNTLVLRTDLSGDPGFADLLGRVRGTDLSAFANADVPFDAVVRAVNPERTLDTTPLVQAVVAYRGRTEAAGAPALRMPGLEVTDEPADVGRARFELVFEFQDGAQGEPLVCRLMYRTELFDAATVERLGQRLTAVLRAVVADPVAPVRRIEVASAAERDLVTGALDAGGAAPRPRTLPGMLAEQVARRPDVVALSDAVGEVTYAELDRRSAALAGLLAARGVGPDSIVGVAMPRSAAMVTALLGVVRAGAAFLPLDIALPQERLRHQLTDSGTALVLTGGPAATLPAVDGVEHLSWESAVSGAGNGSAPADPTDPARAAYVIYTSGSTGLPKGTVLTHAGLAELAVLAEGTLGVHEDSRVLQFSSPGFDVMVFEVVMAVGLGGTLVVAPDKVRRPDRALTDFLTEHRVDVGALPPSLVTALPEGAELPEGMTVLAGTEQVPPDLIERWSERLNLFVAYGLTETTVNSTLWRAGPGTPFRSPIGQPDPGTRMFVLDDALVPVPPGVPGELYIAGAGLARGYLGRHALTAERFVACPFGPAGERMYRTGDRVRLHPGDGGAGSSGRPALEFLGRADGQVKIRGYRVEPGEIEAVLSGHPGVAQAAVVVRRRGPVTRLIGYVVPVADSRADGDDRLRAPDDLDAYLRERLPEHMVPAALVVLDRPLPRTPNNKIDRAALPEPEEPGTSGRGPQTEPERVLAAVVADLLGLAEVGVDDDFFALGGDSIIAIRLVSAARAAGFVITPRTVFTRRTVAALAAVAEPAVDAVTHDPGTGPVPGTPILQWLGELGGGTDGFNQAVLVDTPAGLDEATLRTALAALVDRHAMLRARTAPAGSGAVLEIPEESVDPAGIALTRVPATGQDLRGQVAARAIPARDRLDPRAGVLLSAVLFDLGDDEPGRLLLVVHHVAVDWVTWRILLDDLAGAVAAVRAGAEPDPAPVPTSYRTWAELLAAEAARPQRVAELPRWEQVLGGARETLPLRVPFDPERDVHGTNRVHSVALPVDVSDAVLHAVPRASGASVDQVLLAALGVAVTAWARRSRGSEVPDGQAQGPGVLPVAVEGHGREEEAVGSRADLSRTVGWFTSLRPVPVDTSGLDVSGFDVPGFDVPGFDVSGSDLSGPDAGDAAAGGTAAATVLQRLREYLAGEPDHGLGFGLLRHLNPDTAPALTGLALPEIEFNYLGRFDRRERRDWGFADESDALDIAVEPGMRQRFPLAVIVRTVDGPDGPVLHADWIRPAAVLDDEQVADLAATWSRVLRGLTRT